MASGTDTTSVSGNAGQAALDRFAGMMIERMRQMKDTGWKQGWIGGASGFAGLPQNVSGRNYSGSNSFFLQLQTAAMGYRLPVYLTFKQAHNLKAHVLKGEKAFPVVYWDMMVKDKYGKRISSEEYRALGKEEKKGMEVIPFIKAFPVYNVQQTTSSRCPNSVTLPGCTPIPPSIAWWRHKPGSARYRWTSVWTGPITLPPKTTLCCP